MGSNDPPWLMLRTLIAMESGTYDGRLSGSNLKSMVVGWVDGSGNPWWLAEWMESELQSGRLNGWNRAIHGCRLSVWFQESMVVGCMDGVENPWRSAEWMEAVIHSGRLRGWSQAIHGGRLSGWSRESTTIGWSWADDIVVNVAWRQEPLERVIDGKVAARI